MTVGGRDIAGERASSPRPLVLGLLTDLPVLLARGHAGCVRALHDGLSIDEYSLSALGRITSIPGPAFGIMGTSQLRSCEERCDQNSRIAPEVLIVPQARNPSPAGRGHQCGTGRSLKFIYYWILLEITSHFPRCYALSR